MRYLAPLLLLLLPALAAQGNVPLELAGSCDGGRPLNAPSIAFIEPVGSFPRIGHDNPTAVDGCRGPVTVEIAFGWNTTTWNGQFPPFDLDAMFGTRGGCLLWVAPDAVQVTVAVDEGDDFRARFTWPVPNDPALSGTQVRLQALVVDPLSAAGFVLSNAFAVVL